MLLWNTLKIAGRSLLGSKLRTALAMLGIVIGVGAVIAMLAIAAGAQQEVMQRVERMGVNLLTVQPGERGWRGRSAGAADVLTVDAARTILNRVSNTSAVSPVVNTNIELIYGNNNTNSSLYGVAPSYFNIRDFKLSDGRLFTDDEILRRARVAVIGAEAAEELFGPVNPVGETIRAGRRRVEIIGLLEEMGGGGWFNPDDQIIMPYSTVKNQFAGQDHLDQILVQGVDRSHLASIEEEVTSLLNSYLNLNPESDPEEFHVRNQADLIEDADAMAWTFTFLLGGVASISLIVGGIGIMNIMLVTVTERTREIGVRKAIGARKRDILTQFLLEAVFMCSLGGLLGVLLGLGVSQTISRLTEFTTVVQPIAVLIAFGFAAAVGLFFGYYPARKAAALPPIEALRYE